MQSYCKIDKEAKIITFLNCINTTQKDRPCTKVHKNGLCYK